LLVDAVLSSTTLTALHCIRAGRILSGLVIVFKNDKKKAIYVVEGGLGSVRYQLVLCCAALLRLRPSINFGDYFFGNFFLASSRSVIFPPFFFCLPLFELRCLTHLAT